MKMDQKVSCRYCSTNISKKNLKRHEQYCSKNPQAECKSFKCESCHNVYTRNDSFKAHLKNCSGTEDSISKKTSLSCCFSECCANFNTITLLISHLKSVHNAAVSDSQTLSFENEKNFIAWKEKEEARTFSYFSKKNGDKLSSDGDVIKSFYCQQHGSDKAHRKTGEPSRKTDRRVSNGRVKTSQICISTMKATFHKNGTITVIYKPTHSHPLNASSMQFQPLSSESYSYIDAQVAAGVPPVVIKRQLKDKAVEKASILNESAEKYKECYVSLKLIKERARRRRVSKMFDKEDARSVMLLTDHLMKEDPEMVLIYKPLEGFFSRHKRGIEFLDKSIKKVSPNLWEITSAKDSSKVYQIIRKETECTFDLCYYKCRQCRGLCSHLYTCSCEDEEPLCTHVHKLHSYLTRDVAVAQLNTNRESSELFFSESATKENSFSTTQEIQKCHREIQKKILKENLEKLMLLVEDDGVPDSLLDKLKTEVVGVVKQAEVAMSNSVEMPLMCASEPFAPNQKLKTQLSQLLQFKRPNKRKKSFGVFAAAKKKKAVSADLLSLSCRTNNESQSVRRGVAMKSVEDNATSDDILKQGVKEVRVEKLLQCPNVNSSVILNEVLLNYQQTVMNVNAQFILKQPVDGKIDMVVDLTKCREKGEDTCEFNSRHRVTMECKQLHAQNKMWSEFVQHIEGLPDSCPITVGTYNMTDAPISLKNMDRLPLQVGYWKIVANGFHKRNLVFCTTAEVDIQMQRKRKG